MAGGGSGDDRDRGLHSLLLSRGGSLDVVGLATNGTQLVRFKTSAPRQVRKAVTVKGLTGGDTGLVGIDYRVQDGKLYGVGNNKASAGVYSVDPSTGVATLFTRFTVALSGTSFGVDFNPAANALRVVSDNGQNLRQPLAVVPTATATDVTLTYPPATAPAAGITGAAYTNNDLDPNTATTLYDLDTTLDQIALQSPANSGTLAATGKLGVDAAGDTGFDIYSTIRKGSTVEVKGFAAVNGSLYKIALFSGKATSLGKIGASVTDIALPLDQR
ncbi:hypothetical protein ASD11_02670 [Aeromicrobium sp. Root495]|nr:hypothetical protein ASD11_02670 [Aeromicrobium sp. Root495]